MLHGFNELIEGPWFKSTRKSRRRLGLGSTIVAITEEKQGTGLRSTLDEDGSGLRSLRD